LHRSVTDAIPDSDTNTIGHSNANAGGNAYTNSWRNSDA
jgi:hypothetical protein